GEGTLRANAHGGPRIADGFLRAPWSRFRCQEIGKFVIDPEIGRVLSLGVTEHVDRQGDRSPAPDQSSNGEKAVRRQFSAHRFRGSILHHFEGNFSVQGPAERSSPRVGIGYPGYLQQSLPALRRWLSITTDPSPVVERARQTHCDRS